MRRLLFQIAAAFVAVSLTTTTTAKKTYTFAADTDETIQSAPKKLKAPNVQKYDSRNCIFDDSLNYLCLEHSIDLKAGWEIKQRWEVATDINPSSVTASATPVHTYVAPDVITNVGYKYRIRLQPYTVFFFNARPNFKIDRLYMQEAQVNIDQFKSFFYADLVYYQKAVKYTYTGGTAKPATQPDPTSYMTGTSYKMAGINYPGKLCFDIGYNTEDILLTIKTAVNWKDCYKNLLYTLFDYQNWFGPKAMWLDFCDFHTDEDFLLFSYNPLDLAKDTGDVTFLHQSFANTFGDYDGTAGPITNKIRPSSSQSNYYRDCFVLDDYYFTASNNQWYFSFMTNVAYYLLGDYLPKITVVPDESMVGQEQTIMSQEFIDTRVQQQ